MPLAVVIAATVANLVIFMVLPDLSRYQDPIEVSILFGIDQPTAEKCLSCLAGFHRLLGGHTPAISNPVRWRLSFLLLLFVPVFGAFTVLSIYLVFKHGFSLVEKVIAVIMGTVSLSLTVYTGLIIWYALMKMHYLC